MPSRALEKYLSNYRGIDDPHLTALRIIKKKYNVYFYKYGDFPVIWGITARILMNYLFLGGSGGAIV